MSKLISCSDQQLLAFLREGDSDAFNEIYERHWEKTYRHALKKLKDADSAKDITQEIFTSLWINRQKNYLLNLEAYLYSSVRNNVFRLLKREERFIPLSEMLTEARLNCTEADASLLEKELLKAYEHLIQSLCPAQREIYNLRFQENLSTYEIAEQLSISRKTVQNQIGKVLNLLRTSLMVFVTVVLCDLINN